MDEYRMVEVYASQQALDEHMARIRKSGSSLADKLVEPPAIEVLDDLHPL